MSNKGTKHLVITSLLGQAGCLTLIDKLNELKAIKKLAIREFGINGDAGYFCWIQLPSGADLEIVFSVKYKIKEGDAFDSTCWIDSSKVAKEDRAGLEKRINWMAVQSHNLHKFTEKVQVEIMRLAGVDYESTDGTVEI